jgi:dihydroxy-acid dehydratase
LVADGDQIRLDMAARTLDVVVDDAELDRRRADWKPVEPQFDFGVLRKYAKLVGSAASGAVCD